MQDNKLLRLFMMLLAIIQAISIWASENTITVTRHYDINSLMIDSISLNDQKYSVINIEGLDSETTVGYPQLPVDIIRLAVPKGAMNFRTKTISHTDGEVIKLPYRIALVQKEKTNHIYAASNIMQDNEYYNSMTPVRILSEGYMFGDNHIVTIAVYPIIYADSTGEITMFETLDLSLEFDLESNAKSAMNQDIRNNIFSDALDSFTDNPNVAPKTQRVIQSNTPVNSYYYIIVPKKLASNVEKLATWKRQKGYNVTIKSIEDICNESKYQIGGQITIGKNTEQIVDSAASLRAYLYDEFKKNGPYFCFLIGDYRTSMPIRKVCHNMNSNYDYDHNHNGDNFIPTDNYFSDFSTKWELSKPKGHSIYTCYPSVNFYPDIVLGRLLCSTGEEIANYTDKLIIYEANPGLGDNDYLKKAFYFEQDLWKTNVNGNLYRNGMIGESKIVRSSFDPFGDENTTIVQDLCHYPDSVSLPHTGSDIIKGMSNAGFISTHGHGSPTTIATCHYRHFIVSDSRYSKDQLQVSINPNDSKGGINDMTNIHKPSVLYSISCDVNPFDMYTYEGTIVKDTVNGKEVTVNKLDNGHRFDVKYNMGSAYTCSGDFGGVAFLGNTRSGYITWSAKMEALFGSNLLNNRKIGIAEALTKSGYSDSQLRSTHHLIGDPEFEMWLDKPKDLGFRVNRSSAECIINHPEDPAGYIYRYCFENSIYNSIFRLNGNKTNIPIIQSDFILSSWRTDYKPFVCYFAYDGIITDKERIVIANEAYLGASSLNKTFVVKDKGNLKLYATDSVNIAYGFSIKEEGTVNINTYGKCTADYMSVANGGTLNIKSGDCILGPGFTVEKGGRLQIICK